MTSGVYLLHNQTKNIYYIGSSKNIEERIKQHFRDLKYNRHCNSRLQEDYNSGHVINKYIYKDLPLSDHTLLFSEEGKTIHLFQEQKIPLYNVMPVSVDFMTSDRLIYLMADLYCKEKFGKNYAQLTGLFVPAEYSLYYETLLHPENEEEIEKQFEPVIQYQKRQRFIKCHYGIEI